MRDIKVYYQPIDGQRTDLAIFSKKGHLEIFEEQVAKVVKQEELDETLYMLILHGMYKMFYKMEEEIDLQRWMDCYVQETRMEWM